MESLQRDIALALRILGRNRSLSAVIVSILAIGLGASTAVFSLAYAMLWRPLPFPDPGRLMSVPLTVSASSYRPRGGDNPWWSYPKFTYYGERQRAFDRLAIFAGRAFTVAAVGESERVTGENVGADYFSALGVRFGRGAGFVPSDDSPAVRPLVVISDQFWRRRFGGDPSVVGRTLEINGQAVRVIGITAPGFRGLTGRAELFVPLMLMRSPDLADPGSHFLEVVGRLASGVTAEQADREARRLGSEIDRVYPVASLGPGWGARAFLLDEARAAGGVRSWVVVLLGAVAFVLLIACANIANLLLARGVARQREIAVRMALGGSRGVVVRQLMVGSAVLGVLGVAGGLALAAAATRFIALAAPASVQRTGGRLAGLLAAEATTVGLDGWVVGFAMLLALVTVVAFGALPALRGSRTDLAVSLKSGGRGVVTGGAARGAIVAVEIAFTLVLLAGSGLLGRSLLNLIAVEPGVALENVLTFQISTPSSVFGRDSVPAAQARALERIGAVPGVRAVAAADCPPLTEGCNVTSMWYGSGPRPAGARGLSIGAHFVSANWFDVLGVRLLRGRGFEAGDRSGAPKVVVISELAAKRYFPGRDPVGQTIGVGMANFDDGATIVGVVSDVRFAPADSSFRPDVYLPLAQAPRSVVVVFARTTAEPTAVLPGIRSAMHQISSRLPVFDVHTMEDRAAASWARLRFTASILGLFALVAFCLAVFGTYSVTAYAVEQSRRDIAIRAALGARPATLIRGVLSRDLRFMSIGVLFGVAASAALARTMSSILFGVSGIDPVVYAGAIGVVVVGATAGSVIPARRVLGVDAAQVLTSD